MKEKLSYDCCTDTKFHKIILSVLEYNTQSLWKNYVQGEF